MKNSVIISVFVLSLSCSSSALKTPDKMAESPTSFDKEQDQFQKRKALEYFTKGTLAANDGKTEEALNYFYEALLYDSKSTTIYIAIAENLIQIKRYDAAEINLKKALAIEPNHTEALELLSGIYVGKKEFDKALVHLKTLYGLDSSNQKAFQMILVIYENQNKKEELLTFVEENAEKVGYSAQLAYTIANYYLSLNNSEQGLKWLEKSLQIDPDFINAKIALTRINISEGNRDEGIESLQEIIKENPENVNILVELIETYRQENKYEEIRALIEATSIENDLLKLFKGEANYQLGHYETARDMFDKVQLDHYNVYFEILAGYTEASLENLESALGFFKNVIRRDPTISQGYYSAATILIQQKNYVEAEELLRIGLVKSRQKDLLQPVLAEALIQLNRQNEAMTYLELLLKKNPNDKNTLLQVARAYQKAKMFEESDALYERVIDIDKEDASVLNNYSYSLSNRSANLERALELVEKALQLEPNNGYYLDTIGWVYYKMGKYKLAKTFILKSIEVRGEEKTSAEVFDHLGDVFKALDDIPSAKEYWQKALEQDKENAEIKVKIERH